MTLTSPTIIHHADAVFQAVPASNVYLITKDARHFFGAKKVALSTVIQFLNKTDVKVAITNDSGTVLMTNFYQA